MARWIIEDYGFSGQIFVCSNCGHRMWDITNGVEQLDKCPQCGEPIYILED